MYVLVGYPQYEFINKICFRKARKVKCKIYKFQYRNRREIQITKNSNNEDGYSLCKNKKRKFITLKKLSHRLKLIK
jgi:hypothetical protein